MYAWYTITRWGDVEDGCKSKVSYTAPRITTLLQLLLSATTTTTTTTLLLRLLLLTTTTTTSEVYQVLMYVLYVLVHITVDYQ